MIKSNTLQTVTELILWQRKGEMEKQTRNSNNFNCCEEQNKAG
jgi:hypothetical protein